MEFILVRQTQNRQAYYCVEEIGGTIRTMHWVKPKEEDKLPLFRFEDELDGQKAMNADDSSPSTWKPCPRVDYMDAGSPICFMS